MSQNVRRRRGHLWWGKHSKVGLFSLFVKCLLLVFIVKIDFKRSSVCDFFFISWLSATCQGFFLLGCKVFQTAYDLNIISSAIMTKMPYIFSVPGSACVCVCSCCHRVFFNGELWVFKPLKESCDGWVLFQAGGAILYALFKLGFFLGSFKKSNLSNSQVLLPITNWTRPVWPYERNHIISYSWLAANHKSSCKTAFSQGNTNTAVAEWKKYN